MKKGWQFKWALIVAMMLIVLMTGMALAADHEHYVYCDNPGVCARCGEAVTDARIQHRGGYGSGGRRDENTCWDKCLTCGELAGYSEHSRWCDDSGDYCAKCLAEYHGNNLMHSTYLCDYERTATEHAEICTLCGKTLGWSRHYFTAANPDVCAECGWPEITGNEPPVELISLTASKTSAKVGERVTFTLEVSDWNSVLEVGYYIYVNNVLYDYVGTQTNTFEYDLGFPGDYVVRAKVRGRGGVEASIESAPLTVTSTEPDAPVPDDTQAPIKAVALTPNATTARVGDTLTFTTQFEGNGEIAWIEYHIYDMYGNHLTGYRGEGSGISGVYHYPTANTGAGKYVARVYLMAQDGTFTVVDSAPVTVTGGTRKAVALNASATTARVGDTLTFTTQFDGDGPIAWIEYHIYDMYGNHLTGYRGEGSGISGVYHYPTVNTGAGKYTARVYLMAQDGTFTHVDSVQVTVTE